MTEKNFIFIEDAIFMIKIGITEEERKTLQKISISLKIYQDFSKVFKSKNLADSIDYEKVVSAISAFLQNKEWILIEDLIQDIYKLLKSKFKITKVDIEISKYCLKNVKSVGVFVKF